MPLAPREVVQPRTDGATSPAARDTSAFGQLYKQHFDGLYDFVARIVRDRDLAGEIVQNTFTKAWDELRAGGELRQPKAWLYAVARNQAVDEVRRRRPLVDEPLIYAQPDPSRLADPQAVAEDNEMVELVWSSAAALNPDEYSLLDLHVRHGFAAPELAEALQLERGAVYTRLSRLRSSLEESVASTLLVRRGREDCSGLAAIVAEHEGGDAITPQLRRAVRAHVKDCEICGEARRRVVSPVSLFGALTPVVPLAGVHQGILAAIVPGGAAHAAGAGAATGGAATIAARQGWKLKYIAGGAGGLAAVVTVAALALSPGPSVRDPSRASSVDHAVGVASADSTVTMRWPPGKNADGYSVVFSRDKSVEPPARENVTGTQYTSPPLAPGRWWFILRSHGRDGGWTHTLRVGPFVIKAPIARTPPPTAKAPKRAKHRRPAHKRHPQRAPAARRPAPSGAAIVAGVRAAPPAPKPAAPTAPTKKKRRKKSSPAPATPPPAVQAPPVAPSPPAADPVTENPPPPAVKDDDEDEERDDDDDERHDDEDHDEGGGRGGGDHGHGPGD